MTLIAERNGAELRTTIRDDGSGLPEEFRAGQSGLGTQIVQALVSGEMRGRITWEKGPEGGTDVIVEVTLRKPPRACPRTSCPRPEYPLNARCPGHPCSGAPGHTVAGEVRRA